MSEREDSCKGQTRRKTGAQSHRPSVCTPRRSGCRERRFRPPLLSGVRASWERSQRTRGNHEGDVSKHASGVDACHPAKGCTKARAGDAAGAADLSGRARGRGHADTATFTAGELLGKPTASSVTINIVPASTIQYRYQYGTASGTYTQQTDPVTATGGQPSEVTIQGLSANTLYYYRMVYDADGSVTDGDFETRPEHTFRTQRAAGAPFVFTVTSDIHNNVSTTDGT